MNSATIVQAATTPSQRPNHGPGARPRTMRHPPGSSSRHSGLNSSRLWLVQPKRCAVKNHTNSISAASTTQRTKNGRSEEHTSELQSLMLKSYAVFCLKKKTGEVVYMQVKNSVKYAQGMTGCLANLL